MGNLEYQGTDEITGCKFDTSGGLQVSNEQILDRLGLLNEIGSLFLSDDSLETIISRSFELTGRYLAVDRIYLSYIANRRSTGVTAEPRSLKTGEAAGSRSFKIRNCWNGTLVPGSDTPDYAQAAANSETSMSGESYDKYSKWLIVNDVADTEDLCELIESSDAETEPRAFISAPVKVSGAIWGILTIDSYTPRKWEESDIACVRFVVDGLGSAIMRSEMQRDAIIAKEKALREKEQAEYNSRAKSDLMARISAGMGAAVNSIISMTDMVEDVADKKHRRYCNEKIKTSGKDLKRVIQSIHDMVELERGDYKLSYGKINIVRLLRNICESQKKRAEAKGVIFSVDIGRFLPISVIGDVVNIRKVLNNILYNALEYTPEHGEIKFRADKLSESEDSFVIIFEVTDNGTCMTQEQQFGLGTDFYKMGRQNDDDIEHGIGLGLFNSVRIAELMGGSLDVESKPGNGVRFRCKIKVMKGSDSSVKEDSQDDLLFSEDRDKGLLFIDLMNSDLPWASQDSGDDALSSGREGAPSGSLGQSYPKNSDKAGDSGFDGSLCKGCCHFDGERCSAGESFGEGSCRAAGIIGKMGFGSGIDTGTVISKGTKGGAFEGKHVLLAEDDRFYKEVVARILEGAMIDWAEDGRSAIEKYSSSPDKYDIVLMDIIMPQYDGIKVARMIRESKLPGSATIPIIAVSSDTSDEVIIQCFEAGINDHVSKPVDSDILIEAVNVQLSRS